MGKNEDCIRVVSLDELEDKFKSVYVPFFVDEVIKKTDQRYFTRNKIYVALIIALTSTICFAWQYSELVYNLKRMQKNPQEHKRDVKTTNGNRRGYTVLQGEKG